MRAVILAGGRGTRLRPYTVVLPKPLMPIGEYPILEVIVRQLVHCGFTQITMAVNHQAKIIQAFFGNGERWGITIDYSLETQPLSTMGPLRLIDDLPENFLVMNGDILTDLNFGEFHRHHVKEKNNFTIAAYQRVLKSEYGVLKINRQKKLCGFEEKPEYLLDVSMGVYMVNRETMRHIPADTPYGFDHLMLDLLAEGHPASVKTHKGFWLDIGRPDDYMQAIEEFDSLKGKFLPNEGIQK
jgi:NDP-sugar pyrophosphorylase family protein